MVPWRKAKQRQQRGNLPKNSDHGALADLMPRPPLTFILSPRNEGRGQGEGCIGRLKTCVSKFMKWIPFLTVSPPVLAVLSLFRANTRSRPSFCRLYICSIYL